MPSMRVGIITSGLVRCEGGLEFLCGLINSLLATPSTEKAELIVPLPALPPKFWAKADFKELEGRIKRLFRRRDGAKPPRLDVPVIASDIPVNLEIDCGQVVFFPAGDAEALAVLMDGAFNRAYRRRDDQALPAKTATKARKCGEVIWQALRAAQESRS